MSGKPRVTPGGAIRVDMTGMDRVVSLEEESLLIRVQAGISIAVLKSRLSEKRLMMGWSIYSERPHTLGAVLAGRVAARWGARFGRPQDTLRSMTAVLPDGGIVIEEALSGARVYSSRLYGVEVDLAERMAEKCCSCEKVGNTDFDIGIVNGTREISIQGREAEDRWFDKKMKHFVAD